MIERLGPDCVNCSNYAEFHPELQREERLCAEMAGQFGDDTIETRIVEGGFICTAAMRACCNAKITYPRLELVLKPED